MLTDNNNAQGDTGGGGEGQGSAPVNAEFVGSLPEDLRNNEAFYGFEDLGGLAKSYAETIGQLSEKEKTLTELQGKIPSIPNSASEYQIEPPEGYSEEDFNEFREFAHETGMSQEQATKAIQFSLQQQQAQKQKNAKAAAEAINGLKTEWGDNFPTNSKMAKDAVARFGSETAMKMLAHPEDGGATITFNGVTMPLGDHPEIAKMFLTVAGAISEDTLLTGSGARPNLRPRGEDGRPILKFNM